MTNAEARFNKIHIRKVYACLAVTCHLHFWQNDLGLLRATAVTRGWNGYRNKSQHRKSTLEKKILPPFQQGFEPATFQSRVRCSNHWAIPAPFITCVSTGIYIWFALSYWRGRSHLYAFYTTLFVLFLCSDLIEVRYQHFTAWPLRILFKDVSVEYIFDYMKEIKKIGK